MTLHRSPTNSPRGHNGEVSANLVLPVPMGATEQVRRQWVAFIRKTALEQYQRAGTRSGPVEVAFAFRRWAVADEVAKRMGPGRAALLVHPDGPAGVFLHAEARTAASTR